MDKKSYCLTSLTAELNNVGLAFVGSGVIMRALYRVPGWADSDRVVCHTARP
jgi:hypothetical protein